MAQMWATHCWHCDVLCVFSMVCRSDKVVAHLAATTPSTTAATVSVCLWH